MSEVDVVRRFRPHIVITQDPERSMEDLDPDRRQAMDVLESHMALSGGHIAAMLAPDEAERPVPGFADLATDQERGRAVHREIDRAVHHGHGIPAHGSVVFGEAYRRMGRIELDRLKP